MPFEQLLQPLKSPSTYILPGANTFHDQATMSKGGQNTQRQVSRAIPTIGTNILSRDGAGNAPEEDHHSYSPDLPLIPD